MTEFIVEWFNIKNFEMFSNVWKVSFIIRIVNLMSCNKQQWSLLIIISQICDTCGLIHPKMKKDKDGHVKN